jgi:preprotein translocase subunit YajC
MPDTRVWYLAKRRCIDRAGSYIPAIAFEAIRRTDWENGMFVTPAYAQAAVPAAGGLDMLMSVFPFVLIFIIMYFLIIRPQRTQMKQREQMLAAVQRGDTVVTGGGVVGKITKIIDDKEAEVEIANGVKVRVVRSMIADVRIKGTPVADNKNS